MKAFGLSIYTSINPFTSLGKLKTRNGEKNATKGELSQRTDHQAQRVIIHILHFIMFIETKSILFSGSQSLGSMKSHMRLGASIRYQA